MKHSSRNFSTICKHFTTLNIDNKSVISEARKFEVVLIIYGHIKITFTRLKELPVTTKMK
jgi:hypothetical protein